MKKQKQSTKGICYYRYCKEPGIYMFGGYWYCWTHYKFEEKKLETLADIREGPKDWTDLLVEREDGD
jgi:hypothetical protein